MDRNHALYELQTALDQPTDAVGSHRWAVSYAMWQQALFSLCVAPNDARLAR